MRTHQLIPARVNKIILVLLLTFFGSWVAFVDEDGGSQVAAAMHTKIEATIFTYDGQDFVRTQTTLVTEEGALAVNTKLDNDSPAYKALAQKRSYSGSVTLFGKKYDGKYAPLTGEDGGLTGALFVAVEM